MPTGKCSYPQHHRDDRAPGIVQLVALLVIAGTVAIIVTHWKAVVACIVIAGVVLVLVAALMALSRNHGRYYDPELEQRAGAGTRSDARCPTSHQTTRRHRRCARPGCHARDRGRARGCAPASAPAWPVRRRNGRRRPQGDPAARG